MKRDLGLHKRLCDELFRLGGSNAEVAKKLHCHPNTVNQWLTNEHTPSAHFFKNFHDAGMDIIYILTGERSHFSSNS